MTAALAASGLGKQYGRRWALSDCTLHIPQGQVVGLVGPNGAGKTTLLHLAVGLLRPTAGTIEVLGRPPSDDAGQLGRVGFVAQDTPVYSALSVADHLRLGAWLNPRWDEEMAQRRISQVGLDPGQRAGKLSGGQRAQLALTLAVAKRPELLILDEPVASLDPLARREFLQLLMAAVAEGRFSIVLSSHLVADLERVCDYLVVLASSRVQVAGEVDELLATHRRLIGPRRDPKALAADLQVIEESHTDVQSTLVVRCDGPVHDPAWTVEELSLEDLVLAYMGRARQQGRAARRGWGCCDDPADLAPVPAQATVASGALAVIAVVLAITGPQLVHLYHTSIVPCQAQGDCSVAISAFVSRDGLLQGLGLVLVVVPGSSGCSGGAAAGPRTGDRHLPAGLDPERPPQALAGGQARPGRPGERRRRRAAQPHGDLVVEPDRPGERGPVHGVRPARHRPVRLRRLRLRARRHRRDAAAPDGARDGRHPRGLRRHPPGGDELGPAVPHGPPPHRLGGPGACPGTGRQTRPAPLPTPATGSLSDQTINAAGQVIGQDGAISYGGGRFGILFGPAGDGRMTLQGVGRVSQPVPGPGRRRSRRGAERRVQPGGSGVRHQAQVRQVLTYQPTSRYWPLQWYELAIFAGLALILAGFCFWWMRRRFA